jgi:hypothetical protein
MLHFSRYVGEAAFTAIAQSRAGAIFVDSDAFFFGNARRGSIPQSPVYADPATGRDVPAVLPMLRSA